MTKFKVGDLVLVLKTDYPDHLNKKLRIQEIDDFGNGNQGVTLNGLYYSYEEVIDGALELINGDNTVKERRTFKLLKDTPTVKKGALYQEQCDDGTQPYQLLDKSFHKTQDRGHVINDRDLIENQPNWFVEVFKVTPQYMTQEELDQWESFKADKPKRTYKRKATKGMTGRRHSEATKAKMRAAQAKRLKG